LASLACRKLTAPLDKAKATLILSHQSKSKLGVFWGNPETNIGGDAFNFHDSICINLYKMTAIKDTNKKVLGHYGSFKTTKNKLFPPHREAKFRIINGKGFNKAYAILQYLVESSIVRKKSAGIFEFKGYENLSWRGEDNFSQFLKTTPEAMEIVKKVIGETKSPKRKPRNA
jgi:recombination protein RecA